MAMVMARGEDADCRCCSCRQGLNAASVYRVTCSTDHRDCLLAWGGRFGRDMSHLRFRDIELMRGCVFLANGQEH